MSCDILTDEHTFICDGKALKASQCVSFIFVWVMVKLDEL